MSSEWPTVSIGELADARPGALAVGPFGSRMKADLYVPAGVRVIRGNNLGDGRRLKGNFVHVTTDVADSLASCCLIPGDLVFPHRGNIGEVGITPDDGRRYMLSTSLMKLSPNREKVDPLYLLYFFKSSTGRSALLINASQVGTPGIATPLKSLRGIELSLPPLEVQRAITVTLQALDDRITLLRETNATLEAIAQALFKSWFVDFDPVRAKMEGRAPEGMDEATAALFPDSFEETELGAVPRGWNLMPLAEAMEINPTRKLKKGELAPYLDMASVGTQGHVADAAVLREMGSGSKFVNGDTLLARITPCLENGKTAFVDFLPEGKTGWGSTEFVVLRPRAPLPDYFAYLLCRHGAFREFAIQSMSGTSGRQRIQNDVLGRYLVAVPTRAVAEAFGQTVSALQQRIAADHASSQTLSTLRDTLLPRLISGQLRLPEITTT